MDFLYAVRCAAPCRWVLLVNLAGAAVARWRCRQRVARLGLATKSQRPRVGNRSAAQVISTPSARGRLLHQRPCRFPELPRQPSSLPPTRRRHEPSGHMAGDACCRNWQGVLPSSNRLPSIITDECPRLEWAETHAGATRRGPGACTGMWGYIHWRPSGGAKRLTCIRTRPAEPFAG